MRESSAFALAAVAALSAAKDLGFGELWGQLWSYLAHEASSDQDIRTLVDNVLIPMLRA